MHQLTVPVADILGRPGEYRDLDVEAILEGVANALVRLDAEPVRGALRLESVVEGILVTGRLEGSATMECSRCLRGGRLPVTLEVCELYVDAARAAENADAYRLTGPELELEPLLRDALGLELPLNPLCAPDCRGLCPRCGHDLNFEACTCVDDDIDPRWAALSGLRERLGS